MSELADLVDLRHRLHRSPELSGQEQRSAQLVADFVRAHQPDELLTGVGGHGLMAIFRGPRQGPRLLLRSDLDALPIPETLDLAYASQVPGVAHKCGHDGHSAILAGLAPLLHRYPPRRGEVVLLFQPAEETGEGAPRVLADPRFQANQPDIALALHNLPGYPLGQVVVRDGTFAAASTGLALSLVGDSSHASEPHNGRSPTLAVAQLIAGLSAGPQLWTALHEAAQVTVIHARLGDVAFGTSPGEAVVMATLRSHDQQVMMRLRERCAALAEATARTHGLELDLRWVEPFVATVNDPACTAAVRQAAGELDLALHTPPQPFPWSEDFGALIQHCPGAMFGLGAGEQHPALHNRAYDFPDDLIETGRQLLARLVLHYTGGALAEARDAVP